MTVDHEADQPIAVAVPIALECRQQLVHKPHSSSLNATTSRNKKTAWPTLIWVNGQSRRENQIVNIDVVVVLGYLLMPTTNPKAGDNRGNRQRIL
jgi:hypothetical protein